MRSVLTATSRMPTILWTAGPSESANGRRKSRSDSRLGWVIVMPLVRNKEKRQRKYRIHRQELRPFKPVAPPVAGNERRDNRAESHGDQLEVIENERHGMPQWQAQEHDQRCYKERYLR